MDYAIVEISGKQFKVQEGRFIDVDLQDTTKKEFLFDTVLLISTGSSVTNGVPYVKGASVSASLVKNFKDKKIIIFKQKPKKGTRLKQGHRQQYSRIMIDSIKLPSVV